MGTAFRRILVALCIVGCGDDGGSSVGSTSGTGAATGTNGASTAPGDSDVGASSGGGDTPADTSDEASASTSEAGTTMADGESGTTAAASTGSTGAPLGDCDGIPVLVGGIQGVYMEVESIDAAASWTEESDAAYAGFSGAYFQWIDTSGSAPTDGETALQYCFALETQGTYWVEINGRRDHDVGTFCETSANDGCNDVWVQVDGQGSGDQTWTKKMQSGPWDEWRWDGNWDPQNGAPFRTELELSSGTHLLGIAGRSHRVKIDAIRVYLVDTEPPTP